MLQAMSTGHDGSIATIHANSARECLGRLEMMMLLSGFPIPQRAMRQQIAAAVNMIVHVARLSDGSRKVMKISEISGMEGEMIMMQDLYEFNRTDTGVRRRHRRQLSPDRNSFLIRAPARNRGIQTRHAAHSHRGGLSAMELLGLLLFVMVFGLVGYFVMRHTRPARETRQLESRLRRPQAVGEEILRDQLKKERGLGSGLGWFYNLGVMHKLEQSLWQAGIYRRVSDVLLLMLLMFGAGATIGAAFWQDPALAIALGVVLALIPIFYIQIKRKRRIKRFVQQLPFALDLIKSSLEAGHSLLRGLQVVVGEFEDPIATEFRSVIEQTRLGFPLPRAMEEMLKRVPDDDLRLLIVAVRVQSEVGSSLAVIIERLAEIVRIRQRLGAQVRALTAQARMSGWVVAALPVILLAAFSVIQPSYTHTLILRTRWPASAENRGDAGHPRVSVDPQIAQGQVLICRH